MILARRQVVGSDAVIIVTCAFYAAAAAAILLTREADWTPLVVGLLYAFKTPPEASLVLLVAAAMAAVGQWCAPIRLRTRVFLLAPQMSLITATTVLAVASDASRHTLLSAFLAQMIHFGLIIIYVAAVVARVRGS